jgi:rare lipoprotein A
LRRIASLILILALAACSTSTRREAPASSASKSSPWSSTPSSRYYKDDGPPDGVPANLDSLPDAEPKLEPLHPFANRPYTVLGRDYVPATSLRSYKERGVASWYGRKFHGQKTSIGETYDMFAMTAAHPTLPLPSYARVTNVATGKSVVVRVNDRGPFLYNRVIDLSYAAAHRIGIAQNGSGLVEVEAILPTDSLRVASAPPLPPVAAAPIAPPPVAIAAGVTTAPVAPPPQVTGTSTLDAAPASPSPSAALAAERASLEPVATVPHRVLPSESPPASGSFSVQLGAFANFANAQNFLTHMQNQLASAQVEPKIRQAGGLYRVYVGPYADREEARRAGDRIAQAFGLATTIAPQ